MRTGRRMLVSGNPARHRAGEAFEIGHTPPGSNDDEDHRSRLAALLGLAFVTAGSVARAADELKVGDKAPDFSLKATDGKTYTLADFKGKKGVVLAWFPKADTGGCTAECKSIRDQRRGAQGHQRRLLHRQRRQARRQHEVRREVQPRLPDPQRPRASPPPRPTASSTPAADGRPLDLLHRQGRRDQGDRQEDHNRQGRRPTSAPRSSRSASAADRALAHPGAGDGGSPLFLGSAALEVHPAGLELAQDPPEQAAVHPARDPAAFPAIERVGLGVFEVVGHLVQERVEQLFDRSAPAAIGRASRPGPAAGPCSSLPGPDGSARALTSIAKPTWQRWIRSNRPLKSGPRAETGASKVRPTGSAWSEARATEAVSDSTRRRPPTRNACSATRLRSN